MATMHFRRRSVPRVVLTTCEPAEAVQVQLTLKRGDLSHPEPAIQRKGARSENGKHFRVPISEQKMHIPAEDIPNKEMVVVDNEAPSVGLP